MKRRPSQQGKRLNSDEMGLSERHHKSYGDTKHSRLALGGVGDRGQRGKKEIYCGQ
jgi:hypothetical protein